MPDKTVVKTFLEQYRQEGWSPNSLQSYTTDLNQLEAFLAGNGVNSWQDTDEKALRSYLFSFLEEMGYSGASIARKCASARRFFGWMHANGYAAVNHAGNLRSPTVRVNIPKATANPDINRLKEHLAGKTDPQSMRNLAIILLITRAGATVSELVNLDTTSLVPSTNLIMTRTHGGKYRTIAMNYETCEAVNAYLTHARPCLRSSGKPSQEALFLNRSGQRITRQGIWLALANMASKVGASNFTPRALRHSLAAQALQSGNSLVEVQRMLGHLSLATTKRTYSGLPTTLA